MNNARAYLLKMALKNISRHRGRTILSLLAILAGVFAIIFAQGFTEGTIDNMVNLNVNLNSGHVRMIQPDYEKKERLLSLGYPIGEGGKTYSEIITGLRKQPGVKVASGRIRFGMYLVSGEERQGVMGMALDFQAEEPVTKLSRYLKGKNAGRLPKPGGNEIVLGQKTLNKLGLKIGDKVNTVFGTSFGGFKIATFKITGAMSSGLKMLDEGIAYVPLDTAMSLLEYEDAVTEIILFGDNIDRTQDLLGTVNAFNQKEGLNLKVIPWNAYNEFIAMLPKYRAIMLVIYIIIALLASFVVFNTLTMVVAERTREIGMLTALGFTAGSIKKLFLLEGSILAVLGSLTGTVLGGLANFIFSIYGIDFSDQIRAVSQDFLMSPVIYSKFSLGDLFYGLLIGIIVTVIAAYLPARRAAILKPTEALRTI
jgi:putative ABC transport system permease protein